MSHLVGWLARVIRGEMGRAHGQIVSGLKRDWRQAKGDLHLLGNALTGRRGSR